MTTTLAELSSTVRGELRGDAVVDELAYDSHRVSPGDLFFCIRGRNLDGHDFAEQAVVAGARALVLERPLAIEVPQLVVPSVRAAMGPIAAAFFGHPSRSLRLVGVTGTNGKTTFTYMMDAAYRAMDRSAGLIGNIERLIGSERIPVDRNTPEAPDLQRLLARMRTAGVTDAVMEVTSEGLIAGRVDATSFSCAVFTNLSQDHLNTHGTMEAYFDAKAMLFTPAFAERAVINVDDPYGRTLLGRTTLPVTTVSLDADADVHATAVAVDATGSTVEAIAGDKPVRFRVPLTARYNVANALCVLGAGVALGFDVEQIVAGIAAMPGVPGRLESVDVGQGFTVLVDYAHTPDSLENVLRAARDFTPPGARLVVVFGCGGDRDRGKRPLMGKLGASLADRTIITSDNPRSEDPTAIVAEIEAGARESGRPFESIVDRKDAIEAALTGAGSGDVIVIAGKGHESGQEFADRTIPFDDRAVAREILEALCSR